jgi:hypothetical protein
MMIKFQLQPNDHEKLPNEITQEKIIVDSPCSTCFTSQGSQWDSDLGNFEITFDWWWIRFCGMRDKFAKTLFYLHWEIFLGKKISKSLKYEKIRCLLQEICTNLSERNCKVVYKYEGIWTCEGCIEHINKKIEHVSCPRL